MASTSRRDRMEASPGEAVPLLGFAPEPEPEPDAAGFGGFAAAAGGGPPRQAPAQQQVRLGTFLGVFVPCLANIFGLTIFVRVPFIVGQAGLAWALGLYVVSTAVSSLTLCSICALVTNGHISGGGAYFIISRSLGPEFGGAIGAVFYLANLISVTAYCNVMTTQLKDALSVDTVFVASRGLDDYLFYTLFLGGFTATAMGGARLVARASLLIMGMVLLALYLAMLSLAFRPAAFGHPAAGGSAVGPNGTIVPNHSEYGWFTGASR